MRIAMYGSGAAGSVFASYLRAGGAEMVLIDRYKEHMDKVAKDGMNFTIHHQEGGEYKDIVTQLTGFTTYTNAADCGPVDIIIFMTKATQLDQAIQDAQPCIGPNTVAVSLINGLGNDDMLLKYFPKERCVIGSGVLGTALTGPGACVSTPSGDVQMNFGGIVRSELNDKACEHLLKCFRDGGCDAYWRQDDIYYYLWKKVLVNATVNTVCVVLRLKICYVADDPYGYQLFEQVVREAAAVATARGTKIDADDFLAHDLADIITNIGDYYPSMCQDVLMNKRQTEISVLNGKIAEYGKELGIPTPTNAVLSQVISCIQNNYDNQYKD